jgi:quinolinate synthase
MLRLQPPLPDGYTSARPDDLATRIGTAKAALGPRLLILGHHYQRDEVMRWADARGDSFGLSRLAADNRDADYVVFCGVHFMAESADILTAEHQQVLLPDLNAGCSMADMADLDSVEEAWDSLRDVTDVERIIPITYMNSSAALKAFVGRHGGAVCTSSNARAILSWALDRGEKVLFFPDQHLGRNTGYQLGYDAGDMRVWDPRRELGGLEERDIKEARLLLWKGHCSVHQRFRPEHVEAFRAEHPTGTVIVHPECSHEIVELADQVGSTDFIIKAVDAAAPGSVLAVATEIHLVQRRRASRSFDPIARSPDLPVFDHVPHRRRPPLLGPRAARRRRGGQPHHG